MGAVALRRRARPFIIEPPAPEPGRRPVIWTCQCGSKVTRDEWAVHFCFSCNTHTLIERPDPAAPPPPLGLME